jgi:hypothetical protein
MNPPLAGCILIRSNLVQLLACPSTRWVTAKGYEFIYIAPGETKFAKRAPALGGLGGLRRRIWRPKETAAHIEADLKSVHM